MQANFEVSIASGNHQSFQYGNLPPLEPSFRLRGPKAHLKQALLLASTDLHEAGNSESFIDLIGARKIIWNAWKDLAVKLVLENAQQTHWKRDLTVSLGQEQPLLIMWESQARCRGLQVKNERADGQGPPEHSADLLLISGRKSIWFIWRLASKQGPLGNSRSNSLGMYSIVTHDILCKNCAHNLGLKLQCPFPHIRFVESSGSRTHTGPGPTVILL